MRRSLLRAAPLLALLIVSAGVAAPTALDPKNLVLRKSDVPAGFKLAYAGPPNTPGVQASNARGWGVSYQATTPTVASIGSNAFVFVSSAAAQTAFATITSRFGSDLTRLYGPHLRTLAVPRLGDEQRGWVLACDGKACPKGTLDVVAFARKRSVLWTTSLFRAGARQAVVSQLLTLARKQQQRVGTG